MTRTTYQHILMVVSIVMLAVAAIGVVVGVYAMNTGISELASAIEEGLITSDDSSLAGEPIETIAVGITSIIFSLIEFVIALLGIRAARNEKKIMPVWCLSVVVMDLLVITLIVMFILNEVDRTAIPQIIALFVVGAMFYTSNKVKGETEKLKVSPIRLKVYELVDGDTRLAKNYGVFMIVVIIASLLPLCFKDQTPFLDILEHVSVAIFSIDYILRLLTADLKLKKGAASFLQYPITPMAIIDLLSILPTFIALNPAMRTLRIVRLIRVIRVFKLIRYLRGADAITRVFVKHKKTLIIIQLQALGYVIVSAIIVFNVEPDTFESFFDALYWAVVSLTTVGYGDLYPTSDIGRVVSMVSSLVGVAIVALPSGVITAGLLQELREQAAEEEAERLAAEREHALKTAAVEAVERELANQEDAIREAAADAVEQQLAEQQGTIREVAADAVDQHLAEQQDSVAEAIAQSVVEPQNSHPSDAKPDSP